MVRYATTGGASADPIDEPALKMPTPRARWLAGNHSATALAAAGQFPGSPSPSRNRHAPSDHFPRASPCNIAATDQVKMNTENPIRVPRRSTRYPEPAYMMAYAKRNAVTM